jgi:hypothetical protein
VLVFLAQLLVKFDGWSIGSLTPPYDVLAG